MGARSVPDFPLDRQHIAHKSIPVVVALHRGSPGSAEARASLGIGEQRVDRGGDRGWILGIDQDAGFIFSHRIRYAARPPAHDGQAAR